MNRREFVKTLSMLGILSLFDKAALLEAFDRKETKITKLKNSKKIFHEVRIYLDKKTKIVKLYLYIDNEKYFYMENFPIEKFPEFMNSIEIFIPKAELKTMSPELNSRIDKYNVELRISNKLKDELGEVKWEFI